MARVLQSTREQAARQLRVISKLEKAAAAYAKRGTSSVKGLKRLLPALRDCSVAAHLVGVDEVMRHAPIKASLFEDAINLFRKRSKVSVSDLRDAYGDKARDALDKLGAELERDIAEDLADLAEEGTYKTAGTKAVWNALNSAGVVPGNSYAVENLFRTQTLMGYGGGRWLASRDPAVLEILKAYQYVTVGDDRVREEHEALDGMLAGVNNPIWSWCWPPNGYSCRCQCILLFDWDGVEDVPDYTVIREAITPGFGFNPGELFSAV